MNRRKFIAMIGLAPLAAAAAKLLPAVPTVPASPPAPELSSRGEIGRLSGFDWFEQTEIAKPTIEPFMSEETRLYLQKINRDLDEYNARKFYIGKTLRVKMPQRWTVRSSI